LMEIADTIWNKAAEALAVKAKASSIHKMYMFVCYYIDPRWICFVYISAQVCTMSGSLRAPRWGGRH
jgi:hypothetical protein